LFVRHRNPSSFPVRIRRAVVRLVVSVGVILLLSGASQPGGTARAQTVAAVPSKSASVADPYAAFVREAAQRFGVPTSWISTVMMMESGGDVLAVSSQGAMGLMQIMPTTWAGLRARYSLGADPYEPRDNILAGAAYLREMYDHYGSPGFLAAYNAGPARYDEYLATGRELPTEAQLYVALLTPLIGEGQAVGGVSESPRAMSWRASPLFVARHKDERESVPSSFRMSTDRPSNGRSAAGVSALAPQMDGVFVRRGNAKALP
jgi:hypothetical protein